MLHCVIDPASHHDTAHNTQVGAMHAGKRTNIMKIFSEIGFTILAGLAAASAPGMVYLSLFA